MVTKSITDVLSSKFFIDVSDTWFVCTALVFWLYDWNRHAYIISSLITHLIPGLTLFMQWMQWRSLEGLLLHSTLGRSIHIVSLHMQLPQITECAATSPFWYVSRSSNLDFLPHHCSEWVSYDYRRQPSSRHNLQGWSKKKWLSLSMFWLCCNEIVSAIIFYNTKC